MNWYKLGSLKFVMIKNYKLVGFLIFIGQRIFFVRGRFKRALTTLIHNLIDYDSSKDIL